jgi:uncharacterized protein YcfJ
MFRKILTVAAFASVAMVGIAPAEARHHHRDGYYDNRGYDRGYDRHHGYRDGRCRDSGTGGAIIGAVGGGLLGNSIAGHGDKTLGTVIGAGGGALAGNAIGRSGHHRC